MYQLQKLLFYYNYKNGLKHVPITKMAFLLQLQKRLLGTLSLSRYTTLSLCGAMFYVNPRCYSTLFGPKMKFLRSYSRNDSYSWSYSNSFTAGLTASHFSNNSFTAGLTVSNNSLFHSRINRIFYVSDLFTYDGHIICFGFIYLLLKEGVIKYF
jgi:hypothetical protein